MAKLYMTMQYLIKFIMGSVIIKECRGALLYMHPYPSQGTPDYLSFVMNDETSGTCGILEKDCL